MAKPDVANTLAFSLRQVRVSSDVCMLLCCSAGHQRRNHVFKVGGPFPWSRVLLPYYRKNIIQVYPVWCSRLHNHTLFIKKLRKKLGNPSKFCGVRTPPAPSDCAHAGHYTEYHIQERCVLQKLVRPAHR